MSDSAVRPISDEEWEDLVRQLHNQLPARPRPFFYSRLQARIADQPLVKSPLLPGWLRRPAYVVLLGVLVMTLNGDGSALRPVAAVIHCEVCPSGSPLRLLRR